MKNILLVIILLISGSTLNAQSSNYFNYQGVARDAQGEILSESTIGLRLSILEDSDTGNSVYSEEHLIQTSKLGVFSLQIGNGNNANGSISGISWATTTHWLQVEMDASGGSSFDFMGVSQLVSVPYAAHARTAEFVDDADADPNNEFQTLSVSGNQLTLSNGNTVNLPTGGGNGSDNDEDPNNEIQDLSSTKTGSEVKMNISLGGGSTTINIDDADADATNEIQTLNFDNGNKILSLSSGGQVDLSNIGGVSGSDDQNLELNGTQLSIEDGNTVDLSVLQDGVDDADADSTNEIQTIGFNVATNMLTLTEGGQVDLSSLDNNGGGTGSGTDDQVLSLSGTQLSIEDGNTVDLSSLQDGVNDADADSSNEFQDLKLENHMLSLNNSDSTIFLGNYISPWVYDPAIGSIVYKDIDPSAIISEGSFSSTINTEGMFITDESVFSSSYLNGFMSFDTVTSVANNQISVRNMFQVNTNHLSFQSSNPNSPTNVDLSKEKLEFTDKVMGYEVISELNGGYLKFMNSNEEISSVIDPIGFQSSRNNPSSPVDRAEMLLSLDEGLGLSSFDGAGNQNISANTASSYALGNGPVVGNFDMVYMTLDRDSLTFLDYDINKGFATYGRDQIKMENQTLGNSTTKLGLDSIFMSKSVGLLFPDIMTLKPDGLKFQGEYNQLLLKNDRLIINDFSSPSTEDKRVELSTNLTMFNDSQWKNIRLGTSNSSSAGQLDIWSGAGDHKLIDLGVDDTDGFGGSLKLFSNNEGSQSSAWLRAHDSIGELQLYGPTSLNTFIGALGYGDRGVIGVYDDIASGNIRASMYVDINHKGVVYADYMNIGQDPADASNYPLQILQNDNYGINLINGQGTEDWEFYVNDNGYLVLYSNGLSVGNFDPSNGAYSSSSDMRVKKDIKVMSSLLPSLLALKPLVYKYKNNNPSNMESLGFLAQDIQPVFPELVTEQKNKDGEPFLTVDYSGLGVVAIKAIQEQQVIIDNQKEKIEKQELEIINMKVRLDRLEQLIIKK